MSIKTEITVKQFLDIYEQETKESDDSNNSLNNSDSASETEESDSAGEEEVQMGRAIFFTSHWTRLHGPIF